MCFICFACYYYKHSRETLLIYAVILIRCAYAATNGLPVLHFPISILPIVAKISERIVYNQLYNYLTKHNILSKNQSGFRTKHSTVTSLLHATNEFYTNADNGLITGVIFIDLKKAFIIDLKKAFRKS